MSALPRRAVTGVLIPALLTAIVPIFATAADFKPVTQQMLEDPPAADWLQISRTYDEQRFSPLNQINKRNVSKLQMVFSRGLPSGTLESTPLVHDGVMYLIEPGANLLAIDATTGDEIWEYKRDYPKDLATKIRPVTLSRSKVPALFDDMVYYTAPDGYVVAVDARTGKLRWESKAFDLETKTEHSGGLIVADGKVISNRTCVTRAGCFIVAHDARTGKELWRFYNTAAAGEPGGDSWGDTPSEQRVASSWGLPGSYDPERRVLYWAVSNPIPYTRLKRHAGKADAVPFESPSELYSNSTLALDIDTGKLVWYYQHLPGDDWDSDHIHERTLIRTKVSPDPRFIKWINPAIPKGEERDIVVEVAEAGDIFALDRASGEFLWAAPFPYDVPNVNMKAIDVKTGRTFINDALVFRKDGDRSVGCFQNTRSYWATSYDPKNNSLYVPFQDACLDMTADSSKPLGFGLRFGLRRPGVDPDKFMGMMKIDMATGEMQRIFSQAAPGNGSALTTAGDLLFWGDLNRRFRAFDPDTGKVLWEAMVGGMVMTSTITYAVDGRQYVAIFTGEGQSGSRSVLDMAPSIKPVHGHNAIYVFALPQGN
jgi:PQQ-dependent dehydrogenase (methanol/ethanol family)